jgi:hypothetical protein
MEMAGASADGEVNHWPAFVDVLTTVIMVVTFLLVIMSAAVMSLSQRVVKEMKEHFEREAAIKVEEVQRQLAPAGSRAGLTRPGSTAEELLSENPVDGEDSLVARSRSVPDSKRVAVAAPADEVAKPTTGSRVRQSDALLAIDFDPKAVQFTGEAEEAAQRIVRDANLSPTDKLEVWSIAPSASGVSGAERLAYYRALATRNILIKAGVPPENISAQVKVTDEIGATHVVSVLVKP